VKKINKILLIDDDEATNFMHERLISYLHIAEEVIVKTNAKGALQYLEALLYSNQLHLIPSLIILDINLPGMNGIDFIKEYKRLNYQKPEVKFLIVSSSDHIDDIIRIKYLAKYDYVIKPLTEEKLLSIYKEMFNKEALVN
jgi:DNA-binding response OmpR family regulator